MHIDHIEKLKGERSAESFSMKKFDRHLQTTSFLANFVGKGVVPASKFQARRNFLTAQFFFRKVHSCNGLPYDCISSGSRIFLRVWFPQVGGLRIPKLYNAQPMFPDFFFFFCFGYLNTFCTTEVRSKVSVLSHQPPRVFLDVVYDDTLEAFTAKIS